MRELRASEWESLRGLVHKTIGIALSPHKKVLLVSRLSKRLAVLGMTSFRQYYDHVVYNDPAGEERQALVNAITTNKTEFYRESQHFEVLREWLNSRQPEVLKARSRGLRIWCAAASTGQEAYTIADVVRSSLSLSEWNATQILATDVDTKVLATAEQAIYPSDDVSMLSEDVRRRMFLRGLGLNEGLLMVRPELRSCVCFSQLNLARPGWALRKPIDLIFCRNVLIYFDRATQRDVVTRMCDLLEPRGLLFLGHSEGLAGMDLQLESVAHTVYRNQGKRPHSEAQDTLADPKSRDSVTVAPGPHFVQYGIDTGVFLLLTAPRLSAPAVYHLREPALEAQLEQLSSAIRSLCATNRQQTLGAKLVYSRNSLEAKRRPDLLARVMDCLAKGQVEILGTWIVDGRAEIRVDERRSRLFVRGANGHRLRTAP